MSWTQVYVSGLAQTTEPSDEELEQILDERYQLSSPTSSLDASSDDVPCHWAGPGTTLIKRDKDSGACRGYAFLGFLTAEGAAMIVQRINEFSNKATSSLSPSLPMQLRAEISQPKNKSKAKSKSQKKDKGADHSDIRLRRQRKNPVRKHPVITSSDKIKTGLGNKTK